MKEIDAKAIASAVSELVICLMEETDQLNDRKRFEKISNAEKGLAFLLRDLVKGEGE